MTKSTAPRKGGGAVSLKPRRSRAIRVDITMDAATLNALNTFCNNRHESRSSVICRAVTEYLAKHADPSMGDTLPPLVL